MSNFESTLFFSSLSVANFAFGSTVMGLIFLWIAVMLLSWKLGTILGDVIYNLFTHNRG